MTQTTVGDVGTLTTSVVTNGYWQPSYDPYGTAASGWWWINQPYSYPQYCWDNLHIFACEHSRECKCGKATRELAPPKCAACGK